MRVRRRQAKPEARDYLARIVDVAYADRSPESRERLYAWILRASPAEVRRVEKLAHDRAQQAYAAWELERENEIWEQYDQDSSRPFAYSRFVCQLRDTAFFYVAMNVGSGEDERLVCYVIEAKPDADPAQLAEQIRKADERFGAAIMETPIPSLSPLLQ